jgi:hypothetical protein
MTAQESITDRSQPLRPQPSSKEEMDRALEELSAHSQEWVDLPLKERIAIAEQVHNDSPKVWERWVDYAVAAKGIAERRTGNDMEWIEIATINRIHTTVLRVLGEIEQYGKPKVPGGYRVLSNGQVAARVYPESLAHQLAFRGVEMDVWLSPGVSLDEANSNQALAYHQSSRMGNDTFHKLFHDLRVVALKMNPVNAYLGPLLEEAYSALIDKGFLRIVYGGAEEGNYLVHHDRVDEVHMTGSDRTFEAIVFGSGEDGDQRKSTVTPVVDKPVEGELGCITPWVVVPGEWSESDIQEQAAKMAFWMMRHEGYLWTPWRSLNR